MCDSGFQINNRLHHTPRLWENVGVVRVRGGLQPFDTVSVQTEPERDDDSQISAAPNDSFGEISNRRATSDAKWRDSSLSCQEVNCTHRDVTDNDDQDNLSAWLLWSTEFTKNATHKAQQLVSELGVWGQEQAQLIQDMATLRIDDGPPLGAVGELVAPLIRKYNSSIKHLRHLCSDILRSEEGHDDIFLLRYVLQDDEAGIRGGSEKTSMERIASKVKAAIIWRETHRSILSAVRRDGLAAHPAHRMFEALTGVTRWRLVDGGWLDYIGTTGMDNTIGHELLQRVSYSQLVEYLLIRKEVRFRQCDAATRQSGRFVKALTVRDMSRETNIGALSKPFLEFFGHNSGLAKAQRQAEAASEFLHPLMTEKIILVDPPRTVQALYELAKMGCSDRIMRKICLSTRKEVRGLLIDRLPKMDLDLLFPDEQQLQSLELRNYTSTRLSEEERLIKNAQHLDSASDGPGGL
eukprot:CAMPEP_0114491814 /NCGR_PEP_ID=MMETSP0109-20121206/3212_1 /TAXON_ID=29199 /ORGANISM="Chlorarachnion reptans, Strain CCCM449" /LENGTH=464 /DNA_ID=CAMNT_0001668595 /DNA_START=492 /DNA_END=1886 /DNA_ORIENTATION=+